MDLQKNIQLSSSANAETLKSLGASTDTPRTPSTAMPRATLAAAPRSAASQPSPSPSVSFGTIVVRYLAGAPILVNGSATRSVYRFSRAAPLQRVAHADVTALLASGYFRRES